MSQTLQLLTRHLPGRQRADLDSDIFFQDFVIRRLTVLGEAAARIGDEFRQQHPEIPWTSIVGLRNVVTHQYDRINLDEIWTVATEEAPPPLLKVETMLQGFEHESSEQ